MNFQETLWKTFRVFDQSFFCVQNPESFHPVLSLFLKKFFIPSPTTAKKNIRLTPGSFPVK